MKVGVPLLGKSLKPGLREVMARAHAIDAPYLIAFSASPRVRCATGYTKGVYS
jgi:hypothetical protein